MAEEYKPNSHRSKEEKNELAELAEGQRVEKVTSGTVVRQKKSGLSRMASMFQSSDANSIKDYIWTDVLVPTIKRTFLDIVCNCASMIVGEPISKKNGNIIGARVNYKEYYRDSNDQRDYARPRPLASYNYDDVIFDNRGDAERVLYQMNELLERYNVVSIADFLDLSGISSNYTDNKYGWDDLRGAHVVRVRDGYIIDLPRAIVL